MIEYLDAFVPTLRGVVEISLASGRMVYGEEVPPAFLYRVCEWWSPPCDCCHGTEAIVVSEHKTLPAAHWAASETDGSWVEFWNPAPDGPRWVRVDAEHFA